MREKRVRVAAELRLELQGCIRSDDSIWNSFNAQPASSAGAGGRGLQGGGRGGPHVWGGRGLRVEGFSGAVRARSAKICLMHSLNSGGLRGILKVTAEACEAAGRESARRQAGRRWNARKYPTVWQRKHRRGCVHTRNKRRLREQRAAFDSLLPSRRGREAAYPLAPLSAPLHKSRKQRAAALNHLPFSSAAVDARVHPRRPEVHAGKSDSATSANGG